MTYLILLANAEASSAALLTPALGLANSFSIKQKDSILIPYGKTLNGKKVQVFNRECADEMVADFANEKKKDPDYGLPIYIGHPDHPDFANESPDKAAYAWIYEMTVQDNGLSVRPRWSEEGEKLLANAKYRYPSPHWGARPDPAKPGTYYPVKLVSIGLTNRPNIRAIGALVNSQQTNEGETQMKDWLIKLFKLANEATDEQIQSAVTALANGNEMATAKATEFETALANEKTARAADKAAADAAMALANTSAKTERTARLELIANSAIEAGKITVAQKPQTLVDLDADLDGTVTRLANTAPVISTDTKTKGLGARKEQGMSSSDKVHALVNERMARGEDYLTAFTNVKKENTVLFAGMKQPGTK